MLEAISDFWKPVKKSQPKEKLQPDQLQQGSSIGFGIVPQASLSGRKMNVSAINTYQFGGENLTSFVLGQDKETGVSMIIAESEGEQYLAISRRLAINDRMKMFESQDLENVIEKADASTLPCKDIQGDFKGWMVANYKREIQGMHGRIFKGDFRKNPLPAVSESREFKYTLLVSDNNEHAIEIEQYNDGRIEVYATVYRRMSDVSEISQPTRVELNRPDLKIASKPEVKPSELSSPTTTPKTPNVPKPVVQEKKETPAVVLKETTVKAEPIKLQEFVQTSEPVEMQPKSDPKITEPVKSPPAKTTAPLPVKTEAPKTTTTEPAKGASPMKPAVSENKPKLTNVAPPMVQDNNNKQEVKTVSKTMNGMDNEAVECELRVANKIIDEAIRNEMRLSDVVRRIIELPVAHQEAVHIPITLSDDDYSLLAIRYGVSPSDRSAIKSRIIEDLNDFSGDSKKKAA